jgi:tetratricopeptide (TPR) repeat protein
MNIQAVAERNNLGVAYLDAGDMKSALGHFSEALSRTMSDLEAPVEGSPVVGWDSNHREEGTSSEAQRIVCYPEESAHYAQEKASIQPLPTKTCPATQPFAYVRGINLIPCHGAYSPDPLVNATIVSSIIIFNLSIIYHLKGLEAGDRSVHLLKKARALYQKCHGLIADAGVPLGATGNPVIDMLSMALYNNLAHVSFEMDCYGDSRRYFEHLIRFSLTVVPESYGDAYVGVLLDQQKSHFLLNAIILQVPKLAAAA